MNGTRTAPRLLSDEQIREAHRTYMNTDRGLRSIGAQYGISHVQLAASFVRLRLAVKGNRETDPEIIDRVKFLRDSGMKWTDIAMDVSLSLRQVHNIYVKEKRNG